MRRSPMFLLVALTLALVAGLAVHSALRAKDARIEQALNKTSDILVAASDLSLGVKLSPRNVRMVKWPREMLPAGAIEKPSAAIGNVVKQPIAANEPILEGLIANADHKSGLLPMLIPSNMRAMSVAVDEVADIAGFVLPHTRVDILATYSGREAGSSSQPGRARIVLENVEVLAVAQTTEKDQPQVEKVVTVLVTPQQAERLALVSHEASMRLALRSYDDDQYVESKGVTVGEVFGQEQPVALAMPQTKIKTASRAISGRPASAIKVEVLRDGETRQALIFDGPRGRLTQTSTDGSDEPRVAPAIEAPSTKPEKVAGSQPARGSNSTQEQAYADVTHQ